MPQEIVTSGKEKKRGGRDLNARFLSENSLAGCRIRPLCHPRSLFTKGWRKGAILRMAQLADKIKRKWIAACWLN